MTRIEDNAWFLCLGILFGLVIQFWFFFDVDFFRSVWPAVAVALIAWGLIRGDEPDVCSTKAKQDDK